MKWAAVNDPQVVSRLSPPALDASSTHSVSVPKSKSVVPKAPMAKMAPMASLPPSTEPSIASSGGASSSSTPPTSLSDAASIHSDVHKHHTNTATAAALPPLPPRLARRKPATARARAPVLTAPILTTMPGAPSSTVTTPVDGSAPPIFTPETSKHTVGRRVLATPSNNPNKADDELQAIIAEDASDPTPAPSTSGSSSRRSPDSQGIPGSSRPRRTRGATGTYNLARLSGTDVHGKRSAKGDVVNERRRARRSRTSAHNKRVKLIYGGDGILLDSPTSPVDSLEQSPEQTATPSPTLAQSLQEVTAAHQGQGHLAHPIHPSPLFPQSLSLPPFQSRQSLQTYFPAALAQATEMGQEAQVVGVAPQMTKVLEMPKMSAGPAVSALPVAQVGLAEQVQETISLTPEKAVPVETPTEPVQHAEQAEEVAQDIAELVASDISSDLSEEVAEDIVEALVEQVPGVFVDNVADEPAETEPELESEGQDAEEDYALQPAPAVEGEAEDEDSEIVQMPTSETMPRRRREPRVKGQAPRVATETASGGKAKGLRPAKRVVKQAQPPTKTALEESMSGNRYSTRNSGLETETLATKLGSLNKRGRNKFEKGLKSMSRELRRLQDTNEFAHIETKPVLNTIWSNGKYVEINPETGEPVEDSRKRKREDDDGGEDQSKPEERQGEEKEQEDADVAEARRRHQEEEEAALQAAEAKKPKVKKWMDRGLYAGQTFPNDTTAALSASQKKKLLELPEVYGVDLNNETFPTPIFNGIRMLVDGRDFKLPFDVCNPLPPGQPKPEEWRKITKNRFVGDAAAIWKKTPHFTDSSTCVCKREDGCAEDCQNRIMLYECDDTNCTVGREFCQNRAFQDLQDRVKAGGKYRTGVEVCKTSDRGYGVRSNRCFEANQIIMEYTGEIITDDECDRRMNGPYKNNECYYLMSFDQNMIIDATTGSSARFVNHSCSPNCRMIKWIVGGQPRMALFAGDNPIMSGDELTYDYNFDPFSAKNVQKCLCGSDNCRGVLGPKISNKASTAAAKLAAKEKDKTPSKVVKSAKVADSKRATTGTKRKANVLSAPVPDADESAGLEEQLEEMEPPKKKRKASTKGDKPPKPRTPRVPKTNAAEENTTREPKAQLATEANPAAPNPPSPAPRKRRRTKPKRVVKKRNITKPNRGWFKVGHKRIMPKKKTIDPVLPPQDVAPQNEAETEGPSGATHPHTQPQGESQAEAASGRKEFRAPTPSGVVHWASDGSSDSNNANGQVNQNSIPVVDSNNEEEVRDQIARKNRKVTAYTAFATHLQQKYPDKTHRVAGGLVVWDIDAVEAPRNVPSPKKIPHQTTFRTSSRPSGTRLAPASMKPQTQAITRAKTMGTSFRKGMPEPTPLNELMSDMDGEWDDTVMGDSFVSPMADEEDDIVDAARAARDPLSTTSRYFSTVPNILPITRNRGGDIESTSSSSLEDLPVPLTSASTNRLLSTPPRKRRRAQVPKPSISSTLAGATAIEAQVAASFVHSGPAFKSPTNATAPAVPSTIPSANGATLVEGKDFVPAFDDDDDDYEMMDFDRSP